MESLDKLLKTLGQGRLGKIVRRAQDMDDLAHRMRTNIDPTLAAQILSVSTDQDDELVIVCSSQAWASRLRFVEADLIDAAQKAGVSASRCRIKVRPQV